MPELPEVETIRQDLDAAVIGRRVTGIFLHEPLIIKAPSPEQFVQLMRSRIIKAVDRQAKYLLFTLDDDWVLVVHLMVEGQLLYQLPETPLRSSIKLVLTLDNGWRLVLRDVADLVRLHLLPHEAVEAQLKLHELGPEPIDPDFNFECFERRLTGRKGMIKPLLLNQRIMAGLGNIYVDEALFRARLHPTRKVNQLSPDERQHLFRAIRSVLKDGIAHRGTSARGGFYRDIWGRKGQHQDYLQVFRRQGEACYRCGGTIERTKVSGKDTYFCPTCQQVNAPLPD